jgi:hypothetical protein
VQLQHIFREAGGVSAVTQLLQESDCPLTVQFALKLIQKLMGFGATGAGDRRQETVDDFFHSGRLQLLGPTAGCQLSGSNFKGSYRISNEFVHCPVVPMDIMKTT